jgi:hypothetical protein
MPNVVVDGGVIECSHHSKIKFSGGAPQLQVSGSGAITSGMEAKQKFASGTPPCTGKPPANLPCTSSPATVGVSTLLTVGGVGVLLSSAQGLCVNLSDPSATWSITSPGETVLSVAS